MIHSEQSGFDDAGTKIPVVGFDFSSVDGNDDGDDTNLHQVIRKVQAETVNRLLQYLLNGDPSADEVYRRVVLRQHLLRPEKTQAEIGLMLGISQGRVAQMLIALKAEYKGF